MSAQISRDQNFPAACKRCGGQLYEDFEFCPYCGTECPLDRVAPGTQPKATLPPLGTTPAAPPVPAPTAAKVAHACMPASNGPALNPSYPPVAPLAHSMPLSHGVAISHMPQWIFPRGLFVLALVLVFAYGTYLLLGTNRQREGSASEETLHSAGGSVASNEAGQQSDAAAPAAGDETRAHAPSLRRTHTAPQFSGVADGLRVARTSLAENNLFDAKAAANAVLARDTDNAEAHAILGDIATREQRRDSALQSADRCVAQRAWGCVEQQASEALAIDSSSPAAQSLMERAIVSTAWKPLSSPNAAPQVNAAPPAPLPRGAPRVRLPSSQDWNTSASPPPLPSATNTANAANTAANMANTANTATAANLATPAVPSSPASSDNSVDAQERAIVQDGWKQPAAPGASH